MSHGNSLNKDTDFLIRLDIDYNTINICLLVFLRFGQLHSELYRACELVVDTGIHGIG